MSDRSKEADQDDDPGWEIVLRGDGTISRSRPGQPGVRVDPYLPIHPEMVLEYLQLGQLVRVADTGRERLTLRSIGHDEALAFRLENVDEEIVLSRADIERLAQSLDLWLRPWQSERHRRRGLEP